jgi:hypothetical protein
MAARRIEIRARRQADAAGDDRRKVAEDIAEEIEPTTTSKLSGRRTKFIAAASTSSDSVSMSGNSSATF